MAGSRVCVIDSSPVVRETIAAVLSGTYAVEVLDAVAAERAARRDDTALYLIEDGLLSPTTITRLVQQTPVLWLRDRATNADNSITRCAAPTEIIDAVAALLGDSAGPGAATRREPDLCAPRLSAPAAHVAQLLARSDLPCLISGEPGCGKMRVARALHRLSGAARLIAMAPDSWPADLPSFTVRWKGPLTLCVANVDRLSRAAQRWLLDIIESNGIENDAGLQPVRVIALTCLDPRALQRLPDFDRTLELRLATMPLELQPLRDRATEIAALVAEVARDAAARLRRQPATFNERALHRLRHYTWPGNLAELEAVVARSIALSDAGVLDVTDLQFGFAAPHINPPPAEATPAPTRAPGDAQAANLNSAPADLIIQELCHEFRNPMSTIKTIGQHIGRLMQNEEGREQLAQLTGEAIDRMDRVLDSLVRFTELGSPQGVRVAINAILGPAVADLGPTLTEKHLVLDYQPSDAGEAWADVQQVSYAVGNILEAVAAELEDGGTITIRPATPTPAFALEFKSSRRSIAVSLAGWLDSAGDSTPSWLPLGVLLGRSVIERNSGQVNIDTRDGRTIVTVLLPAAKGSTVHGEAPSIDSGR